MTGFEEARPMDGMSAPLQVRAELRHLFERWLSRPRQHHHVFRTSEMVDELSLLSLCRHYRLEYPGGVENLAQAWDESEQRIGESAPSFSQLVELGWVFFDGGRWNMQSAPVGTYSDIKYPGQGTKAFLLSLGKPRLLARTDSAPEDIQALAAKIDSENWLERGLPCNAPDWTASRLWGMLCPKPQPRAVNDSEYALTAQGLAESESERLEDADTSEIDKAFLEWSAWCAVLKAGSRWDTHWEDIEKHYCRKAAHRALIRQSFWGTWEDDASRYANVLANTFAIPADQLRYARLPVRQPPDALVFRADWLGWPEIEHLMMERRGMSTVGFAFGLLCSELERTDLGPGLDDLAKTVISFVANHPLALQHILFRVDVVPALLVDLLMHERTACLAAKLVIERRPESRRGSDRNLAREAQTKGFAIQDALSLLTYHLDKFKLDPQECSALLSWCYAAGFGSQGVDLDSRRPFGIQLLAMAAKSNDELQSNILRFLVNHTTYRDNIPRARFTAVLNGLESLAKVPLATTSQIVTTYSTFAREMNLDWTDASSLPAELAARLVATAFAQTESIRDALLIPFDSVKLLKDAPDGENSSLGHSIARTLRVHIRLLSRAVAGWAGEAIPQELSDVLLALITKNVIERAEKWRVGALTDRYRPTHIQGREEGSPALDIAAAWRRLNNKCQESLLLALSQTDDPVLLAELCQQLPAPAKSSILAKLRHLKPQEASDIWMWPEVQHRVDALLAAGEYELAREHLESVQPELPRAPQKFRLNLYCLNLQLLMMENNWTTLDSSLVPSSLDEASTRQATDYLAFYKATSQLLRPDGNLDQARAVLERLAAQPSAPSAYRQNAFAVAIRQLLGPPTQLLTESKKTTAEKLLAEINAAMAVDAVDGHIARTNLLVNRAQLLLALQRPEEALASVATQRLQAPSVEIELIIVRANSDMGRPVEAMAVLDAAILEFGPDDRLAAAKQELQLDKPISTLTAAAVTVDTISSIRAALHQLSELPISDVGDVLGPPGGGVRGYLMRQVSRAVGSLQNMSAMLRKRTSPKNDAKLENDLNTAVREILRASLVLPKWSVSDQSLGGTTLAGNPGERDAVIIVSNEEIAIYEALVCSGLNKTYTKEHFHKLVGYGACEIYFLVVYSYAKKVEPLLDYIRKMLEQEAPDGFTFVSCEKLTKYPTIGYSASYRADHRLVEVVFFVVNLKSQVAGR